MKTSKMNSWDKYFIEEAQHVATRSKDARTKVGAVIVKDKHVLSSGYNGAPVGFPDEFVPDTGHEEKELVKCKHSYIIHAEVNAILNYAGSLKDLHGATLYVTLFPCYECAKVLIQAGIKKVIYLDKYHDDECCNMSKLLFKMCGINVVHYDC